MSDDRPTESFPQAGRDVPVECALVLEEACDRFESTWRARGRPDIWAGALEVPEPVRPAAVREMVALDIYYRRKAGEAPAAADYLADFPELEPEWLAAAIADVNPNGATATGSGFTAEIPVEPKAGRFGGYELLGEIAHGAMGVVYRARDVKLDRIVALKMIRSGEFANPAEVRRFRQEAEAAATLDHPNIVSIFEVGDRAGQHYYAMRLVNGGSLASRMAEFAIAKAEGRGDVRRRHLAATAMIATVARAVHHAHQRGVLHRDLKPANILLDAGGAPHVVDFGLARRIGADSTLTRTGAILGTPSYMAPEQARGIQDVTTEADVYGLGAVLYHVLSGRPPFEGEDVLETLYQVRGSEPVKPRVLCPAADRDLETICLKCLEKETNRRYSSAAALADDLDRWLRGEPIEARRARMVELAAKWVRRNPAGAGLIGLAALTAAAVIWALVALSYNAELAQGKDDLEAANGDLAEAKQGLERLNGNLSAANAKLDATNTELRTTNGKLDDAVIRVTHERNEADRLRGVADGLRSKAERQELTVRDLFYVSQFRAADRAWLDGKPSTAVQHLFPRGGAFMRNRAGAEWAVLGLHEQSVQTSGLGTIPPLKKTLRFEEIPPDPIRGMALSPDGKQALVIIADPEPEPSCSLWDLQTQQLMRKLVVPPQCAPDRCSNSIHTGDRVFVESRNPDCVLVWNTATVDSIQRIDPPENCRLWSWAVSAGGRFVAALYSDGSVRVIQVGGSIKNRFEKFAERPVPIAVDAEGDTVYRGGATPAVFRANKRIPCSGEYAAFAWNADGSVFAAVNGDRVALINPATGVAARVLGIHARANRLAFSSAGTHLVSSDSGGGVNIWNLNDGTVRPHVAERLPVYAIALVEDRLAVATRGVKNPIELTTYDIREAVPRSIPFSGQPINVAFSPDGAMFLTTVGQKVEVWDLAHLQPIASLTIAGGWNSNARAAFSPCGRYIGAGYTVFDIHNGFAARTLPFQGKNGRVCDLAFQPRGSLAAIAIALGDVQIFDLDSNSFVRALPPQKGVWNLALAFSPDGRRLAVGYGTVSAGNPNKTSPVVIYDVATGAMIRTIPGFLDGVWSVAWSPDGRRLATGSGLYQHRPKLGEVKIWDTQTWELVYDLKGHKDCVWSVAFSPDGRRLASAAGPTPTSTPSDIGEYIIWDLVSGQQLLYRNRLRKSIAGADFSANGQWFGIAESGGVRLWNLTSTRRAIAPLPHAGRTK